MLRCHVFKVSIMHTHTRTYIHIYVLYGSKLIEHFGWIFLANSKYIKLLPTVTMLVPYISNLFCKTRLCVYPLKYKPLPVTPTLKNAYSTLYFYKFNFECTHQSQYFCLWFRVFKFIYVDANAAYTAWWWWWWTIYNTEKTDRSLIFARQLLWKYT